MLRAREVAMVMKARIRKARTIRGYSQAELASRLSVTRSAVANWECGAKLPSSARLQALAIATDVSYEWLATGRGVPLLIQDLTPAADAEIVDEVDERKLLSAYRASTKRAKGRILDFVASTSTTAKRIIGSRG
jgi:transcriptional regulator with XRE-family HTH domain